MTAGERSPRGTAQETSSAGTMEESNKKSPEPEKFTARSTSPGKYMNSEIEEMINNPSSRDNSPKAANSRVWHRMQVSPVTRDLNLECGVPKESRKDTSL